MFDWRDGERTIHFGRGRLADAVDLLGGPGFTLLTTPRAAAAAAHVVAAAGERHDVPAGKVTDYQGAVQARDGENVIFSWVEWPSKEARDQGWERAMKDPRMEAMKMPFDGQRMIYGGFATMLDA